MGWDEVNTGGRGNFTVPPGPPGGHWARRSGGHEVDPRQFGARHRRRWKLAVRWHGDGALWWKGDVPQEKPRLPVGGGRGCGYGGPACVPHNGCHVDAVQVAILISLITLIIFFFALFFFSSPLTIFIFSIETSTTHSIRIFVDLLVIHEILVQALVASFMCVVLWAGHVLWTGRSVEVHIACNGGRSSFVSGLYDGCVCILVCGHVTSTSPVRGLEGDLVGEPGG